MTFFNIGPMELLLILVVILIVFGPNRLPEIGADIGRTIRKFRQASKEITKDLDLEELNSSKILDVLEAQAGKEEERASLSNPSDPAAPSESTNEQETGESAATEPAAASTSAGSNESSQSQDISSSDQTPKGDAEQDQSEVAGNGLGITVCVDAPKAGKTTTADSEIEGSNGNQQDVRQEKEETEEELIIEYDSPEDKTR